MDYSAITARTSASGTELPIAALRQLNFADRRIPENTQTGKSRHCFFEEFDLFAAQFWEIEEPSREVLAGTGSEADAKPKRRGRVRFLTLADLDHRGPWQPQVDCLPETSRRHVGW
jgi:hypothetical protein